MCSPYVHEKSLEGTCCHHWHTMEPTVPHLKRHRASASSSTASIIRKDSGDDDDVVDLYGESGDENVSAGCSDSADEAE